MLEHLRVQNVALIEEVGVQFGTGLNILTGETGAGKSILIDSINFVLGGRVDREFVRKGTETAVVEAFFVTDNAEIVAAVNDLGVKIDDDGAVLMARMHNSTGKTTCKINGKTVTISMMREVASLLIDVHGQHEHQSLFDSAKHLPLLDRFCQQNLEQLKVNLAEHIAQYKTLQKSINTLSGLDGGSEEQLQFYRFQMEEISAAKLMIGEEEGLIERKKILLSSEKINSVSQGLLNSLRLDDIIKAIDYANQMVELDGSQASFAEELSDVYARLEELTRGFARYAENISHNEEELDAVESRLDVIYRLKQKYKKDLPSILQYCNELQTKFDTIENSQTELARLADEKKALEKEIGRTCLQMSKIRRDAADVLSAQIEEILQDLGMEGAKFSIAIERRKEFGKDGFDRVQFLISANKGEELAPLDRIASGGEMSRTMLALKTALSSFDNIPTFIFDEIDTGISGRTAQQVAEKLATIAKSHQILCITHLPQIAAMGDVNFLIEKIVQNERNITNIQNLDENGVINEIARLTGGAEITATTTKAAKEMRKLAVKSKK
ncbi:MAG: DNA repair protein RecN [Defluviitaleaceae bacterium]|nr:DNA repair protein RecN [Defluviitaleaceae bacterium]